MKRSVISLFCVAACWLVACGSDSDDSAHHNTSGTGGSANPTDAATSDSSNDATNDATSDTSEDVTMDTPDEEFEPDVAESSVDVAPDSYEDVEQDSPQDVTQDVAQDVTQDVAQDVTQDVAQDVTQDVAQDSPQEVALDVAFDSSGRPPGQCKLDSDCSGPTAFCSMSAPGGICMGCGSDTDCGNPLEFECTGVGSCRAYCTSDEDCPWGLRCTATNTCALISCTSSCPIPYVCTSGYCRRPACSTTPPTCPTGMSCGQGNICVEN